MKLTLTICILLVLVGVIASPMLMAQNKAVQKSVAVKEYDPVKAQLWRDVSVARKSGDLQRYRELMAQIESTEGKQKADQSAGPLFTPPPASQAPASPNSPLWGNDVLIRSGDLVWNGEFNIATASDTLGNIYAACSTPPAGSLGGTVWVYRSTDLGVTWSLLPNSGVSVATPSAIQSFSMAVADTANGRWMINILFVAMDSVHAMYNCGSLQSVSFLDDGSQWRWREVLAEDANTKYRSATLATDGFYYPPGTTWFYGAAERVTPSTGISRGIVAMSTRNNGTTWQGIDTTVSGGDYEDTYPRIAFMQSKLTNDDSVYIAIAEAYSSTDRDIFVLTNKYTYADAWSYQSIARSADDEYDPDIAISTLGESMIVTFTRVHGGSQNAVYGRTTDGFRTGLLDTISANSSVDEFFVTASVVADGGNDEWRVAYKWGPDTVMYKGIVGTPRFSGLTGAVVNQYVPTGYLRPCVGVHHQSLPTSSWGGHVVYAGSGPTNLYYDAPDITVGVKREQNPVPALFSLGQNYPNPFNPATTITFDVPVQSLVTLKVYNIIGQEVASLVNEPMAAGSYSVRFDASSLSTGTYFYRISAGTYVGTRKMVLLK